MAEKAEPVVMISHDFHLFDCSGRIEELNDRTFRVCVNETGMKFIGFKTFREALDFTRRSYVASVLPAASMEGDQVIV